MYIRERGREKEKEFSPYVEQEKKKTEKRKNRIMGLLKRNTLEEISVIGGLIFVQLFYAGNAIFVNYVMSLGVSPVTIIIFSSLATFFILSPPAFIFERSKWPKKFSRKLLIQLVLISIGGVTLFQILFLKGIELTSPAIATAMPNLAPGLIFIIAAVFRSKERTKKFRFSLKRDEAFAELEEACQYNLMEANFNMTSQDRRGNSILKPPLVSDMNVLGTKRVEKIDLNCIYSKLKISGTLLCVIGALTLSIMQSANHPQTAKKFETVVTHPNTSMFDTQKIIGCIYLVGAVFVLSSNVVMQASTLVEFPAPISLCAITSLFGVISTTVWELIRYQNFDYGWPFVSIRDLAGYSLFGGLVSGVCVSFTGWAMKKRGPVLVSMFSPIGTVISVILSYLTMGELISFGSITGMFLMFSGLYFFLWAKGREDEFHLGQNVDHGDEATPKLKNDEENPLLS